MPRGAPRCVLLLGLLSYAATRVFLTFSKAFCSLLSHSATLAGGLMKKLVRIRPASPCPEAGCHSLGSHGCPELGFAFCTLPLSLLLWEPHAGTRLLRHRFQL